MPDPILEVIEGQEQLTQPVPFHCRPLSGTSQCEPLLAQDWTGPFPDPTTGEPTFTAFLHVRCDCHEIIAPAVATLPESGAFVAGAILLAWLARRRA